MPLVLPLPIWPHDMSDERMEMLKRAKSEVAVDYQVMPVPAVPGSPGRVLAFGEVPPFFSEVVFIRLENVANYEAVKGAVEFWLTCEAEPPSISEEQWLSAAMGVPVRFVGVE